MGHAGDKPCVVFRVDASVCTGTGHVMRCLVLANELAENGLASHFVCRSHQGHMAEKIGGQGHEVVMLSLGPTVSDRGTAGLDYASWLGADWETDAEETIRVVAAVQPLWLIVDHYAVDARWERRVREATGVKLMVIDGQANREHDCDLLLDQTSSLEGEARWDGLVPGSCKLLVGPCYALLRPEFVSAQRTLRQRDGRVRRIFVAFGGVDEPNATALALDAIAGLARPDVAVDVVVGASNPHRKQLQERCRALNNVNLHVQPSCVAKLMASADLAISAGGMVLLEQCFMQLPSIVVSIAANQIKPARALDEHGAALYAGDIDVGNPEATVEKIRQSLLQLLAAPERLLHMQAVSRELMARSQQTISQKLLN